MIGVRAKFACAGATLALLALISTNSLAEPGRGHLGDRVRAAFADAVWARVTGV